MHQWHDFPIIATIHYIHYIPYITYHTLHTIHYIPYIIFPNNQYDLNLLLSSVQFSQCQTVFCNSLQSSHHNAISLIWKSNSHGMNVKYDSYRNIYHVLKMVRNEHTEKFSRTFHLKALSLLSFWDTL